MYGLVRGSLLQSLYFIKKPTVTFSLSINHIRKTWKNSTKIDQNSTADIWMVCSRSTCWKLIESFVTLIRVTLKVKVRNWKKYNKNVRNGRKGTEKYKCVQVRVPKICLRNPSRKYNFQHFSWLWILDRDYVTVNFGIFITLHMYVIYVW